MERATLDLPRLYEQDFNEFCTAAWPQIEPRPFVPNRYTTIICNALQQCYQGKIKRLLISIPPRSGKSIIASVLFPAWCWARDPKLKLLTGSYSRDYATRDTTKARYLLESPWYQTHWPEVKLVHDQNQKTYYRNTAQGERMIYSVGGQLTAGGADIIGIDDPLNAIDAFSPTIRNRCNSWYGEALVSRLDNQNTGVIYCIMQRLHVNDLAGFLTKNNPRLWTHISLPMEYEGNKNRYEWRKKPGQLLHTRISHRRLQELKSEMGTLAYNAQYQQSPQPRGGNIISPKWIKTCTQAALPRMVKTSLSWDTAIKEGEENDYSACVWCGKSEEGTYYLQVKLNDKLVYPDLRKRVELIAIACNPDEILIEDKASGQQLVQDFQRIGSFAVIGVVPGQDLPTSDKSKTQRLNYCAPLFEAGKVILVENQYTALLAEQLTTFPACQNDDILDAATLYLCRERRYVATPSEIGWL